MSQAGITWGRMPNDRMSDSVPLYAIVIVVLFFVGVAGFAVSLIYSLFF